MALIINDDNYYLMTWNAEYEGITNYRVDRMDEVVVEDAGVVMEFNEKLIGVVHDALEC